MPAFDLEAKLLELERKLASLTLDDLPLGALQSKLESDWTPDAAVLLQPNSITFDQLAAGCKPQGGTATLTWPGGAVLSDTLVVKHSLGAKPVVTATVETQSGVALIPAIQVFSRSATQFSVHACTVDGTTPLNTATTTFEWIALA